MTAAKKYIPTNDDDRAKVLPLFCGPSKEVPKGNPIAVPPKRVRWLAPKKSPNGGWDVSSTSGETHHFITKRSADDFFEEKAGIGR